MAAAVDLRMTYTPADDEMSGLWACLQQLIGQPFLFVRESYADELTIHMGVPREVASAKLRRRFRGSYVLTLRGSLWTLVSGPPGHSVLLGNPLAKSEGSYLRPLQLHELEEKPPVEVASPVVLARPFVATDGGGFGLILGFGDQSHVAVLPSPGGREDGSPELPELADWELFTPHERYLRVGPGLRWAYLSSSEESATTDQSGAKSSQ